jgi:hypothetical protein
MLSTKKSEILPDQNTAELPTASCLSSQAKLKSRPRKMGVHTQGCSLVAFTPNSGESSIPYSTKLPQIYTTCFR